MQTIETSQITPDQLSALGTFASKADAELRSALLQIIRCVRDGGTLTAVSPDEYVSPNKAAKLIGMSRTHLYKLLDRGEIAFDPVGRDRRIRVRDLLEFETRRHESRRELAQRFANQQKTHDAAIDEIASLL
ncbi:helix-turn-helix domain-containing protein [Mycobacteroides abscessus]|uniref:helix-turn-helix domain-containing protein n=1 Tax=Mycobacteroides abscessus TaxID=36809 RepID=UPI000C26A271|nr:helix-turn-helix domain-containing protein [Mycobacteroides abscessus]